MSEQPWDALFIALAEAHAALVGEFQATPAIVSGLQEARAALSAEAGKLGASRWEKEPEPGEWSLRQMLEHVVAHDRQWTEGQTKGVEHYIDHCQRHLRQAEKIRTLLDEA
jgi:uncharacterized damage-inducible protein DinB